ncbi:phospholipase A [Desulfosediminicola sp.]|uniref:phospholipase A n=1 Tax=Desulfosediminicola sp. TaxID=2886825 RepID=UPI003AF27D16
MTLGQVREECINIIAMKDSTEMTEGEPEGPVETRLRVDQKNVLKPFTLMAHRQNYLLFGVHNFHGYSSEEFRKAFENEDIDIEDTEAQFQLSIKTPLALDLFDKGIGIWGAYTVRSFWQVYNTEISSPFRETNHEPEVWVQMQPEWEFWGLKASAIGAGINHQSNGQASTLSRSWNRLVASIVLEKGNFVLAVKPWYRIPESSSDDDNPDITDFLGHGELRMAYKHDKHVFSLMSRNNLESGFSKGAVEFGWSFPLFDYPYLKGYLQYFSGYGESMIDYNRYVNRLGVGILLTDLL